MAQHRAVARIGRNGGKIPAQGKHDTPGRKEPHPILREQAGPKAVCDGGRGRAKHPAGQKGAMRSYVFCIAFKQ